jgi:hypothetical protein
VRRTGIVGGLPHCTRLATGMHCRDVSWVPRQEGSWPVTADRLSAVRAERARRTKTQPTTVHAAPIANMSPAAFSASRQYSCAMHPNVLCPVPHTSSLLPEATRCDGSLSTARRRRARRKCVSQAAFVSHALIHRQTPTEPSATSASAEQTATVVHGLQVICEGTNPIVEYAFPPVRSSHS